jgi:hypothetical protein
MTHRHYDPSELDLIDPELDAVARRLEGYASATPGDPPTDLADRIVAAMDDEPGPRAAWWAPFAVWRRPAQALAAAAVVIAAITGALAVGELFDQARQRSIGTSPGPSVEASPVAPSVSPSPSLVPSPSQSASPSATPSPTPPAVSPTTDDARTPIPTASDDDDDDEIETPEPSESEHDNSGPGGGGGDDD